MATPLLDLNQLPFDEEDIQQQRDDDRGDIPILVHSRSTNTLVLDMGENEESTYRYWDLNFDFEDVEEEDGNETSDEEVGGNVSDNDSAHIQEDGPITRKRRLFLTDIQREQIYLALLERSNNGKLKRNTTTEISSLFSVPMRTIQRIWKIGKNNEGNVKNKKTKNCGRPRVQVDLTRIMNIPLNKRTTLRAVAEFLGISHSSLFRLLKKGLIRCHSNTIKPHLKEEHIRARLQFCLSMLDPESISSVPKFAGMWNIIHIDEKWFYLTKKNQKYYLHPMEDDPLRTCQSKNFIGKVMFLVAMARPRFDENGNETFSGKLGVFPLVTQEPAIRRSRNRAAETLVTKPIPSVTREVIRNYLIEKVIPSIRSSWPHEDSRSPIFIQQDNARTHISANDEGFRRAVTQSGLDIRLMCQPPNSPDLNILDLGFFSAIQSLQQKKRTNNVDELIDAVKKSFEEYPTTQIERTWISLQLCMNEIMKIGGSNRYKIPHLNKARLERLGSLPKQIVCDPIMVQNVTNQLRNV